MKEELISYETAKLAKEKGFNIPVTNYWSTGIKSRISQGMEYMSDDAYTESNWNNGEGNYPTLKEEVSCSAPTQSLLQRWLREKHNTHCQANQSSDGMDWYWMTNTQCQMGRDARNKTYEEALGKALFSALKLIKTDSGDAQRDSVDSRE